MLPTHQIRPTVILISANIEWKALLGLFPRADRRPSPYGEWFETILDGRAIAQSTTRYQIDGLARMPASGNRFDTRASPLLAGY